MWACKQLSVYHTTMNVMGLDMGGGSAAFSMGRSRGLGACAALAVASASAGPMLARVRSWAAEKHTLSKLNKRFSGYMAQI